MTENELRAVVAAQATGWLGRKEADGSHREIIDIYNSITPLPRGYRMTYADPWCAACVSAVAQAVELTDIIFPECGCEQMIELYKQAGRWEENDAYVPKPGDVIFYDWEDTGSGDDTGSADHVGIVVGVDGGWITLVESNCGDAVCRRHREIDGLYIRGYSLPDYAGRADGENPSAPDGAPPLSGEDSSGADAALPPEGETGRGPDEDLELPDGFGNLVVFFVDVLK